MILTFLLEETFSLRYKSIRIVLLFIITQIINIWIQGILKLILINFNKIHFNKINFKF
jgi:hypothetical protein